ncbi:MAG: PKD domain-containing protein, partial [Dissulfurispiraceae bacterium]
MSTAFATDTGINHTNFSFTPDDNGSYQIVLTVMDDEGTSSSDSQTISVSNVAPTATFTNSGTITPITEGGSGTVSFSNQYDPSPVDASSLRYAYDFNNDGVFEVGNGTYAGSGSSASAAIPSSYLVDGPSDFTVHGLIIDKDGGYTDYYTTVHVNDVPPTIDLSGAADVDEGSMYTLTLGAIHDPGVLDTVTQWVVFWGDNTSDTYTSGGMKTHIYDDNALVTSPINVTLVDQDGAHANAGTLNRTVHNVAPTAIPLNGGPVNEGSDGLVLFVGQNDVSSNDRSYGYHYAYDFNNDGTFEIVDSTSASVTVPGSYLNDDPSKTIRMAIRDKDGDFGIPGTYREYTTTITVNNVAPYNVNAGPDAVVDAGTTWTQSGTFQDPGADAPWAVKVWYGDGNNTTQPPDQTLSASTRNFTLSHVYTTIGNYVVTVKVDDGDGGVGTDTVNVNVHPNTFRVTSFTTNASGFDVQFNRAADTSTLNLYQGLYSPGNTPDITVVGNSVGTVQGSMVWNSTTNTMSFVKTGDVLAADTYTVTLVSGFNAWKDNAGSLLDGEYTGTFPSGDGNPGGNFITTFTVAPSSNRVVSVADFARGAGQPVNVPATGTYLPIRIDNAAGVTAVDVWVEYDPTLLHFNPGPTTILPAIKGSGVPGSWALTYNLEAPGLLKLSLSGPVALTGTNVNLISLIADVPATAPYGNSEVIKLTHLRVNEGNISATADYAIHKAMYLGDADGSQKYNSFDATLISRVVVNLDTGFDAALWTDPIIVGDTTGDGTLSALDASYVVQKWAGIPRPEIPNLPTGVYPLPQTLAVDPQVSIPLGIAATPGGSVNVPVNIAIVPGIDLYGVYHADFDVFFDPNILQIAIKNDGTPDVSFGSFWPGTNNWSMIANLFADGDLRISVWRADPPSDIGTGTIANMLFMVNSTAVAGTTPLLVSVDGSAHDRLIWTDADGSIKISSTVEGRNVFYNNSRFDRTTDDAAIATDKSALLPGSPATFANYTSYSRGINGIMVDIKGLPATALTKTDFVFKVGNDDDPEGWSLVPVDPISITVRPNAGVNGSDRVTIIWADNVIENEWLQVTVKANDNTGLAAPDVFYFGNLKGESGDNATVNISDEEAARTHRTGFTLAPLTNLYDYNRDGQVNASDDLIARYNDGASLWMLDAPLATGDLQPLAAQAIAPVAAADVPSTA